MMTSNQSKILICLVLIASCIHAGAQAMNSAAIQTRAFTPAPNSATPMRMPLPKDGDVIYFARPSMGAQGQWWKDSKLAQQVNVSDDQIQQMDQTFQAHRLHLIDLFADVQRQETLLEPLISSDNPDEVQVSAQIDKVAAARAELEKANARMLLSIRRILTLEQWKRLQSLQPTDDVEFNIPVPPPAGVKPTIKRK